MKLSLYVSTIQNFQMQKYEKFPVFTIIIWKMPAYVMVSFAAETNPRILRPDKYKSAAPFLMRQTPLLFYILLQTKILVLVILIVAASISSGILLFVVAAGISSFEFFVVTAGISSIVILFVVAAGISSGGHVRIKDAAVC